MSDRRARLLPINDTTNPFIIEPAIDPKPLIATIHESSSFDRRFGEFVEVNLGICGVTHPSIIPVAAQIKLAVRID